MASGLFALLDDVAAIAKAAAASIDDISAQAVKASGKAAGIVIDDTAVTPRYVTGFSPDRELPIISRIAWGSLKNKLVLLLPGGLLLSWLAPWAITPLLMLGGAYLCFEGYEKLHEWVSHHEPPAGTPEMVATTPQGAKEFEDERVAGAIRTDMILSAEIMAIALASVATQPFMTKAVTLMVVALMVTGFVYGLVALIVKADDAGLALARRDSAGLQTIGRSLVLGMPYLLNALSVIGVLAMLWVGGGIIIHGFHELGWHLPQDIVDHIAHQPAAIPAFGGVLGWLIGAAIAAAFGIALGFLIERGVALFHSY